MHFTKFNTLTKRVLKLYSWPLFSQRVLGGAVNGSPLFFLCLMSTGKSKCISIQCICRMISAKIQQPVILRSAVLFSIMSWGQVFKVQFKHSTINLWTQCEVVTLMTCQRCSCIALQRYLLKIACQPASLNPPCLLITVQMWTVGTNFGQLFKQASPSSFVIASFVFQNLWVSNLNTENCKLLPNPNLVCNNTYLSSAHTNAWGWLCKNSP